MKIIFTILALMFVYCAAISGNFTRLIFPSSQPPINNVEVSSTGGPVIPSYYTTLKETFTAITPGTHQGDIIVKINASITETASAVLYQIGFAPGKSPTVSRYTSVIVYSTTTGLTISGAINGPLVDLNGADKVTIDWRVIQLGSKDLAIVNTSVTANNTLPISVIRFINSAENNKVKYCTIKATALSKAICTWYAYH